MGGCKRGGPDAGAPLKPKDTLTRLLTICAALSVNAIGKGKNVGARPIAQAVKLDMADWWVPTAESYLNAVPKAHIVQAVAEAGMPKDAHDLAKLKKAQVVAAAQGLLCGQKINRLRNLSSSMKCTNPKCLSGMSLSSLA